MDGLTERKVTAVTKADIIRRMSDDDLAELLVWGSAQLGGITLPDCDEGCEFFTGGCAERCPHERRERAMREYLAQEG